MSKEEVYGLSAVIGEVKHNPYPVFYDPHRACMVNKPPVTLVTGSPGSGKTFFALSLASQASICGKIGAILDPKGDFVCLSKMAKLGYVNNVKVWSLLDLDKTVSSDNEGMLDPTMFEDDVASNVTLTIDVIKMLVGDITSKQNAFLAPIIQDVISKGRNPSFSKVVQKLMEQRDDELRSLGASLNIILQTPLSKLLVINKNVERKPLKLEDGFVVLNLMGIDLPPNNKDISAYTTNERISVCIMSLVTKMVFKLLRVLPKTIFKTLIIDEAWTLMATASGRDLINQSALLGRSLNMSTILLTQLAKHIDVGDASTLDTTISTRFAFRNDDAEDNLITAKAMRLPLGEGWEESIPHLEIGDCLMQDLSGGLAFIHVTVQDGWGEIFDTNPLQAIKDAKKGKMSIN